MVALDTNYGSISYKLYTDSIENCDHDPLAYSEARGGGISLLSRTMVNLNLTP